MSTRPNSDSTSRWCESRVYISDIYGRIAVRPSLHIPATRKRTWLLHRYPAFALMVMLAVLGEKDAAKTAP